MEDTKEALTVTVETIRNCVYMIRGQQAACPTFSIS